MLLVVGVLQSKSAMYQEIKEKRPNRNTLAILCGEFEDRATMGMVTAPISVALAKQ